MKIPEPDNSIDKLIDAAHEARQEPPRFHMGASLLGHACERYLWLNFRWAVIEKFPGMTLRIFRRGKLEETTVVQDLRDIGVSVQSTGDAQSRVDFGCHVSGSVDGIVSNLPHAPKATAVLEIKTHSDKSFKDVCAKGVKESKRTHYVQMQVYMSGLKLDRALYYAINKNDDSIYTEWVHFDKDVADKAIARGKRIALADRMPPPLSTDPSWYECKWCASHEFCHASHTTKQANCRTCAHSTANADSTWTCEHYGAEIPQDAQLEGCRAHIIHPDLVPWKYEPFEHGVTWLTPWGNIQNGEGDANVYESAEILANPQACANGMASEFRGDMGGRIVVNEEVSKK